MKDYEKTFEVLKKYEAYLDSQEEIIKEIRENKKSLASILWSSEVIGQPDIQKCANEIESDMDSRKGYLFLYVEKLLESDKINESQIKHLNKIRDKIFKWDLESNPLLKTKYEVL